MTEMEQHRLALRRSAEVFAFVFIIWIIVLATVLLFVFVGLKIAHADQEPRYKIAVIDTGYDPTRASTNVKLCKTGHYDFKTKTSRIASVHPHGTWIASIIAEKLKDVDYCLVIFQVFKDGNVRGVDTNEAAVNVTQALNDLPGLNVIAANLSLVGNQPYDLERQAIKNDDKAKILIFTAAGNDKTNASNLDENCNVYPACYQLGNLIVVGAQADGHPKERAYYSNYGQRVAIWAPGYYEAGVDIDHGTSYASPRALADYVLFLEHKRLHPVTEKTKCLNAHGGHEGYCG